MARVLIVTTEPHLAPAVLAGQIDRVLTGRSDWGFVEILIPMVLPRGLPISACPDRVVARLSAHRAAAAEALGRRGVLGRVEIIPCRSIPALLGAAVPPDLIVLVGRASWPVRRAARGLAAELGVVFAGTARRGAAPSWRPGRVRVAE